MAKLAETDLDNIGGKDFDYKKYEEGKKNPSLKLFGFDLQEVSSSFKYSLAFFCIGIILSAILYSLRKDNKTERPVKSHNKKEKKK